MVGTGEPSNFIRVALAKKAPTPSTPTVDRDKSSENSLYIEWTSGLETPDIDILGYSLYMIETQIGDSNLIYNGSTNPDKTYHEITGLTTGNIYAFYVIANDFNGESDSSSELITIVCLKPGHIQSP